MQKISFNELNNTKRNHYISQSYLKLFAKKDSNKIFVYNKQNNSNFQTNIINVAIQNKLYVIENYNNELVKNWEEFYTKIVDNDIAEIISQIIEIAKKRFIKKPLLINNIKKKLALEIIVQTLRIPIRINSQKENYNKILNSTLEELEKRINLKNKKNELIEILSNEMCYKEIFFENVNNEERIEKYMHSLMEKTWVIYENNTDIDFIISDNPVIIYDFVNKKVGIQNGIASKETIIAFPINPKFMIVIFPNQYFFYGLKKLYSDEKIIIDEKNVIKSYNKFQFDNAETQIFTKDKQQLDDILKYCL